MTLSRLLDTTLARIRPVSQPSGTFTTRLPMGRSPFPLLVITTTATGLLCWWDSHPLEWQLASLHPSCRSYSAHSKSASAHAAPLPFSLDIENCFLGGLN